MEVEVGHHEGLIAMHDTMDAVIVEVSLLTFDLFAFSAKKELTHLQQSY